MTEAKKPAASMRKDIERQQEKMRELFDELKETVSKPKWDEKPKGFFTALEKKLGN